jgi:hypothetical protein
MEKQIKLAARLYRCRDTARTLYGDEYQAKMKEYREYIEACMKAKGLDELQAVLYLSTEIKAFKETEMGVVNLMAAVVEMLEPSRKIL